jgi:hypothetical protein
VPFDGLGGTDAAEGPAELAQQERLGQRRTGVDGTAGEQVDGRGEAARRAARSVGQANSAAARLSG